MSDTAPSWPVRAGRLFLHEFKQVLPPTIYFFCAFNIIVITTNLLARGYWFALTNFLVATGLALIVGKVVLVIDKFRAIDRFRDDPLIRPIVFKTVFYIIVVTIVRVVEQLVHFALDGDGFGSAFHEFTVAFTWRRFLGIQIWLFVCFFIYVSIRELSRALGEGQLAQLVFHRRTARTGAGPRLG